MISDLVDLLARSGDILKVMLGGVLALSGSLIVNRNQHGREVRIGLLYDTLPALNRALIPASGTIDATETGGLARDLERKRYLLGGREHAIAESISRLENQRFGRVGFDHGRGPNAEIELDLRREMSTRARDLEVRVRRQLHPLRSFWSWRPLRRTS